MPVEPRVSFVITCYNYGQFLGDCLDSILQQDVSFEYEIIVVDDGSTDETPHVARAWTGHPIAYIRFEENRGLGAAIELGLMQARGRFVKPLDADDRLAAGYLERVLPILEQYPQVGAVYGDVAAMDERGVILENPWSGIRSRALFGSEGLKGQEYLQLVQEHFVPWCSLIARRSALASLLPLPTWLPRRFGPMDWYLTLALAREHELYYVAETLAEYRLHPRNNHSKQLADRTRELGVMRVLDHIFAEPEHAAEKRKMRRHIYGRDYYNFGARYLGSNMLADARRCLRRAVAYEPERLVRFEWWRRYLAACIGMQKYNALKKRLPLRRSQV